jgi:hypothetical protein
VQNFIVYIALLVKLCGVIARFDRKAISSRHQRELFEVMNNEADGSILIVSKSLPIAIQ